MKMNVEKTEMMRISRQPSSVHIMRDQKQPGNVEYYKHFSSMITNDARCTREIKPCIALETAVSKTKQTPFTSKLDANLRKKILKCYIWSITLPGAETWTLRKVAQKFLGSLVMWYW